MEKLQTRKEKNNAKKRQKRSSETEEQKLARRAKRNERDRARRARKSAEVAALQASREQDPALPVSELLKPALVVEKTTREIAQQIDFKAEQNGEPNLHS